MMKSATEDLLEKVKLTVDRRDNVWLQLYVCPEYRKTGKCPKDDTELCIYAHPDRENKNLLILNAGLNGEIVVCCFENVFRTCVWKSCKFYHPPDHLKNVVKTNGKNNLRLRNELKQSLGIETKPQTPTETSLVPSMAPNVPYYVLPPYTVPYYKSLAPPLHYAPEPGHVMYKEPVHMYKPYCNLFKEDGGDKDATSPPGESSSKKRSRTPEPVLVNVTPSKRTPPPPQPSYYDPLRRVFFQDMSGGAQMIYPSVDMFNLSMMYQTPTTMLPTYPYLFSYTSIDPGVEQFPIPTLTSNRTIL